MKSDEEKMNEIVGQTYSIAKDNPPLKGCTISKLVHRGACTILYFSLAKNTNISNEIFPYHKMILVNSGSMAITTDAQEIDLVSGEFYITKTDSSVGMKTESDCVYTEVEIGKESIMNEAISAGEAFKLKDLLPYQEGKIVNMDVVHNEKMKFALMAFDKGQGLSEHSAPGEALVFALEGTGTIVYEGVPHTINAGENFHFAKGGMHSVEAQTQFKMALLLALD